MITLARFREIEDAVRAAGYAEHIARSERLTAPTSAYQFATEAIYVIVNSGMRNSVARPIFERCIVALEAPGSCKAVSAIRERPAALMRSGRSASTCTSAT